MNNDWPSEIEPYVFTYCKHVLVDADGAGFPGLFCTSAETNRIPSQFPALLVHEIAQEEIGQDLDNAGINGVSSTFECVVYADSASECRDISRAVAAIMKELRFNALSLPIHTEQFDKHVSISRYRRVFGTGDIE